MTQQIGSWALVAGLGLALAGTACSRAEMDKAAEETRATAESAAKGAGAAAKSAAASIDKDTADKAIDKTKQVATQVAEKTKEVATATAEVVSDGWITAKVSAKFKDEIGLEKSDINVDTKDSVVTLKGTVPSAAAQAKAETIAKGTKGVMKVVNELKVVK